jgi:hypothetical protein
MAAEETSAPPLAALEPPSVTTPAQGPFWRRLWNFGRALRKDSDFYIQTQAVRGGAGTVLLGSIAAGMIFYMQLPLLIAAMGIAACAGAAAVGLCGVALAARTAWGKLRDAWGSHMSGTPPRAKEAKAGQPFYKRIAEHPRTQSLLEKPLMQAVLNSHAGRISRAIIKMPQDLFINSLAVEGSLIFGALSAAALVTGVLVFPVVFPVVALSSFLTVGTLLAAGVIVGSSIGLANSIRGAYLGTRNLLRLYRKSKAPAVAAAAPGSPAMPMPRQDKKSPWHPPLSGRFSILARRRPVPAKKAANDAVSVKKQAPAA